MKKLYVGNLSYEVDEQELSDLFAQHGEVVSVNIIRDKWDNKPKGFAFVEMAEGDHAQAACDALDGTEYKGRMMKVNEAREKKKFNNDRRDGGGNNRGGGNRW